MARSPLSKSIFFLLIVSLGQSLGLSLASNRASQYALDPVRHEETIQSERSRQRRGRDVDNQIVFFANASLGQSRQAASRQTVEKLSVGAFVGSQIEPAKGAQERAGQANQASVGAQERTGQPNRELSSQIEPTRAANGDKDSRIEPAKVARIEQGS